MDTAFPKPRLPDGYNARFPFVASDWSIDPSMFYAKLRSANTFSSWQLFLQDVTMQSWLYVGSLFSVSPEGDVTAASVTTGGLNAEAAVFATGNPGAEYVNANLAVAGDAAISGGLYVAGPASLQSLNAGVITCSALNVPTLYRQAALLYTPISLAFPLVRSVADATALYGSSFNLASFLGTTGGGLWCLVWPGFAVRFLAADGTMACALDNTSGTDLLYSPVSFSSVGVACSSIDVLYLGVKV